MRPAVVVLGAIGTIEITTIRHVKTALQRFAVDEALARFQNVIAGKFAADFTEKLHVLMNEHSAYDSLPVKQAGAPACAFDKSRLLQCVRPADILSRKGWPESESSSLDAAHFSGRV